MNHPGLIQRTRLANGVTVLTECTPHHRGGIALFRYAAGSAHEQKSGWGTAHFLEHMVFQGTAHKNHDRFMMDLARLGATANASTGFESTVYEVSAPAETLLQSVEILCEMLSGFELAQPLVERERDIILEEWRMIRDEPASWGEDCLYHQVLGDFGHPILGTEESLHKMDRAALRKFADAYYTPDQLMIAVVGDIEHQQAVDAAAKWFGVDARQALPKPELNLVQNQWMHIAEENEQQHVFIGFRAPALGDPALPALDILNSILGGDAWSRLFRKIRNELGLAYTVGGFYSGWKNTGLYGIQAATQPDNAYTLLETIRQEVKAAAENISDDEIQLAKAVLQANLAFGADQISWRAERLLNDEAVYGRTRSLEEDLEDVKQVTRTQVLELAGSLLDFSKATLVTVGSVKL